MKWQTGVCGSPSRSHISYTSRRERFSPHWMSLPSKGTHFSSNTAIRGKPSVSGVWSKLANIIDLCVSQKKGLSGKTETRFLYYSPSIHPFLENQRGVGTVRFLRNGWLEDWRTVRDSRSSSWSIRCGFWWAAPLVSGPHGPVWGPDLYGAWRSCGRNE